jgi:uncharacterized protein (DUF1800 family)
MQHASTSAHSFAQTGFEPPAHEQSATERAATGDTRDISPRLPPEGQLAASPGRRQLLGRVMGAAAMAGLMRSAAASDPVTRVRGDVDPTALLEKLVDRITFGATPEELALARTLGYFGYIEYHLDHLAINDAAADAKIAPLLTLTQPYSTLTPQAAQFVINELVEAAIYRAIYSKRQLFERVVEMWTDHFNIDIQTARYYKPADDRLVIRANALGTFPALLNASAQSPAMLYYLNNDVSTASNPNENYARELMELHTLGVNGGYTQTDVQQVARCLTGWTIWSASAGPALHGTFRYNNANHNQSAKVVLGTSIPANGGQQDGFTVLNLLAKHPSTAQYIAFKMCRQFLGYNVAQSIVDRVATTDTATGGDIKAMLRVVLLPEHIAAAQPKLKRPFHHFVSAMRQTSANVTSTSNLRSRLGEAGHIPFSWLTPDGYPDKVGHWGGNLIVRWNFGAAMMNGTTGSISGVAVDAASFFAGATTTDQMIARIDERLFGSRMNAVDRDRVRQYLAQASPTLTTRQREAIGIAIACPSYQWY